MIEDRDHYRTLQSYLQERFFQPVFDYWIEYAVLSGELELNGFETDPERFKKVRWLFRGWAFVDPQKEIKAATEAIRSGLKTQSQVVAELGGDLEDLMAARKREVDQAEQLKLVFDSNPASTFESNTSKVEEKVDPDSNGGT